MRGERETSGNESQRSWQMQMNVERDLPWNQPKMWEDEGRVVSSMLIFFILESHHALDNDDISTSAARMYFWVQGDFII